MWRRSQAGPRTLAASQAARVAEQPPTAGGRDACCATGRRRAANVPVAVGTTSSAAGDRPAGKRPLGGGVSAGDDLRLVETLPLKAPLSSTGWTGNVFNGGDASTTLDVFEVCAPVPSN